MPQTNRKFFNNDLELWHVKVHCWFRFFVWFLFSLPAVLKEGVLRLFLSEFGPGEHFASRADRPSRRLKSHGTGDGQLAGIFPNPFFIEFMSMADLRHVRPSFTARNKLSLLRRFILFSCRHSFLSSIPLSVFSVSVNLYFCRSYWTSWVAYSEQKKTGAAYGLKLVLLIWHCKVTYVFCRLPEWFIVQRLVKFMAWICTQVFCRMISAELLSQRQRRSGHVDIVKFFCKPSFRRRLLHSVGLAARTAY